MTWIGRAVAAILVAAIAWHILTDNTINYWTERHQRAIDAFFQEGK